jgi:hypothetical protein
VGWSVAVVATLINDFLHISVEIGSKLEDFSSRRQTAPELHSEFSSGISRTIVQTGVSLSAYSALTVSTSVHTLRFRGESTSTGKMRETLRHILKKKKSGEEVAMCCVESYFFCVFFSYIRYNFSVAASKKSAKFGADCKGHRVSLILKFHCPIARQRTSSWMYELLL